MGVREHCVWFLCTCDGGVLIVVFLCVGVRGYCVWWLCACDGGADCGGFIVCGREGALCWVGVMGVLIVVVL